MEWKVGAGESRKYYYAGASRIAMRTGSGDLTYLLSDHLGSTSAIADASGMLLSSQGYMPWGETRFGGVGTAYQYTGQYREAAIGLDYYNARWYDPYLGRFTSPDSIIQDPYNVLDWDRYQYVRSNPTVNTDPAGHEIPPPPCPAGCVLWDFSSYNRTARTLIAGALAVVNMVTNGATITDNTNSTWGLAPADERFVAGTIPPIFGGVTSSGDDILKGASNFADDLLKSSSPKGLIGRDFEKWLQNKLGGTGSFKVRGWEFDVAVGDRWIEAKSGNYWVKDFNFQKFRSEMGQRLKFAKDAGKTLELHSNTEIPQHVKDWLLERGIDIFEY